MNQFAITQPEPLDQLERINRPLLPATELDFEIVETMLYQGGIRFQTLHLDRMAASARCFGIPFHRPTAESLVKDQLKVLTKGIDYQIRLRLAADGRSHVQTDVYTPAKRSGLVGMAQEFTSSKDAFRSHQTTRREMYDRLLPLARLAGLDDVLFCNDRGELTEGAIHSLFVKRGKALLTPPLRCGVLPGVYRRFVLETHPGAQEAVLRTEDLQQAEAMYLTSTMTGMYQVELVSK